MKEILEDSGLSFKAKGDYFALVEKDGACSIDSLQEMSTDGRDATRKAINELIEKGYIVREQKKENGRYIRSRWIITTKS